MKKILYVLSILILVNYHACGMSILSHTAKVAGVGIIICGMSYSARANVLPCRFYASYVSSPNSDIKHLAEASQRGCQQYESLKRCIDKYTPLIRESNSLLLAEIDTHANCANQMSESYYLSVLNSISYRLTEHLESLTILNDYLEHYISRLQNNFVAYLDKEYWYCADWTTCLNTGWKMLDYAGEYRKYNVINIPDRQFNQLQEQLERENVMLNAVFPLKGLWFKKRAVNVQLKDTTNLTQQLVYTQHVVDELYDTINPSTITRIIHGEPSSLWKNGKRIVRCILDTVVRIWRHYMNKHA